MKLANLFPMGIPNTRTSLSEPGADPGFRQAISRAESPPGSADPPGSVGPNRPEDATPTQPNAEERKQDLEPEDSGGAGSPDTAVVGVPAVALSAFVPNSPPIEPRTHVELALPISTESNQQVHPTRTVSNAVLQENPVGQVSTSVIQAASPGGKKSVPPIAAQMVPDPVSSAETKIQLSGTSSRKLDSGGNLSQAGSPTRLNEDALGGQLQLPTSEIESLNLTELRVEPRGETSVDHGDRVAEGARVLVHAESTAPNNVKDLKAPEITVAARPEIQTEVAAEPVQVGRPEQLQLHEMNGDSMEAPVPSTEERTTLNADSKSAPTPFRESVGTERQTAEQSTVGGNPLKSHQKEPNDAAAVETEAVIGRRTSLERDAGEEKPTVHRDTQARVQNPMIAAPEDSGATRNSEQEPSRNEPQRILRTLSDHIENAALGRGPSTIRVHLNPVELGSVTLVVKTVGNRVDAELNASNDALAAALNEHKGLLGQSIQSRGLTLGEVLVGHGGQQNSHSYQAPDQQQEFQRVIHLRSNAPADVTPTDPIPNPRWVQSGVNYLI